MSPSYFRTTMGMTEQEKWGLHAFKPSDEKIKRVGMKQKEEKTLLTISNCFLEVILKLEDAIKNAK